MGGGEQRNLFLRGFPLVRRLREPFLCEFPEEVRNSFLHVLPVLLKELHVRGFPGSLKKPLRVSKGAEGTVYQRDPTGAEKAVSPEVPRGLE